MLTKGVSQSQGYKMQEFCTLLKLSPRKQLTVTMVQEWTMLAVVYRRAPCIQANTVLEVCKTYNVELYCIYLTISN